MNTLLASEGLGFIEDGCRNDWTLCLRFGDCSMGFGRGCKGYGCKGDGCKGDGCKGDGRRGDSCKREDGGDGDDGNDGPGKGLLVLVRLSESKNFRHVNPCADGLLPIVHGCGGTNFLAGLSLYRTLRT